MLITPLKLKGVFEIQLQPREDQRGFFMRSYDEAIFAKFGLNRPWVQENHSLSVKKGTIRGMHFQFPPHAETKLVRVVSGTLFDVFIDLRKDSPTFGQWESIILSAENKKAVYIPRGFAHGNCALTDNVQLLYKVDNYYAPQSEGTIKWNDPDVGIEWPAEEFIVSEKDAQAKGLREFATTHEGLRIEEIPQKEMAA